MRILQVTPFFEESYGGTERYTYFLSNALANNGNYVTVYTSYLNIRHSRKIRKNPNLFIHRFYTLKNIWGVNPLAFIFPHVLWNASYFDVIHVHSYIYFLSNQAALAKIYRETFSMPFPPMFLHIHGGIGFPPNTKIPHYQKIIKRIYDQTLGRITLEAADAIFVMSNIEKQMLTKHFNWKKDNFYIIPNAVDDRLLKYAKQMEKIKVTNPDKTFTLIYVGDLEPWKGVENLIHMMQILVRSIKDIKLKIIGDGSQRHYLEKLATGLPIWFSGYLPHEYVIKELANADIFVFPSLWEGMPTAILEAMALKVPVISTFIGAIPEIITNNVSGILIRPNDPKALAQAVMRFWEDSSFAQDCARKAFNRVSDSFVFSKVAQKTEKIYKHVINSGK